MAAQAIFGRHHFGVVRTIGGALNDITEVDTHSVAHVCPPHAGVGVLVGFVAKVFQYAK